jgi:hypothetical protein
LEFDPVAELAGEMPLVPLNETTTDILRKFDSVPRLETASGQITELMPNTSNRVPTRSPRHPGYLDRIFG